MHTRVVMRVTLLGPVSADLDGAAVRLGGRQQRAVFALLALGKGRPVSLDRMVHELWRDEPPAGSTVSLQSYISRLRRNLAEAGADRPGTEIPKIVTQAPGWRLAVAPQQIDLWQFESLALSGSESLDHGHAVAGAEQLRSALALWAGDPLADLDDMPFADEVSTRFHAMRIGVEETLLWADLDSGRINGVAESAHRFTVANPFRERGWCALMLALYRQGRQAEALDAADRLRRALADGLGLDPSPEARRLQEQILRQDPVLERYISDANRLVPEGGDSLPVVADHPPSEPSVVLVGRDETTAVLDDVAAHAAEGRGCFVLVGGPAGMGKSAVLDALTARMQQAGGLVLRGGGVSQQAMPALWPWVAVIRQLVAAVPSLTAGEASLALSLLEPSVGTGAGATASTPGQDPMLARTLLYRAIIDLLESMRERAPLAVLIDDAHWLDPDTLGLLALTANELVPRGVVVAVALRHDESPEVTAEIESVASRHRNRAVRLDLAGLDLHAVRELLRYSDLESPGLDLPQALVTRTGGNPLFVWELVRLLTSERRSDAAAVEKALPSHVRDVLRRRLGRLPGQTQSLLAVVALINQGAAVSVLAGVTGMSEDDVLDFAEAAVASSLLVEDPSSGEFRLSHDLVRQTLEELLSTSRKTRLHARIARTMQADEARATSLLPERVAEIARHLVLAESVVGADAAIPYLVAVADDARTRSAFHLTERALRAALDLSARIADPKRRAIVEFELRIKLTLQSNLVSGPPGSRMFGDNQTTDGRTLSVDVAADPVAWWGQQIAQLTDGRVGTALSATEKALTRVLPTAIQAMVHSTAGLCHFIMGHLELADENLALAETLERRGIDGTELLEPWVVNMVVSAPTIRAGAAVVAENWAVADAHVARARTRAGTSPNELIIVEYHSAWRAAQQGDARAAQDHAAIGLELADQLGNSFYDPMLRVLLGWAQAMLGDPGGAATAEEGCADCATIGMRFQETVDLMPRAEAHARHGNLDSAKEYVRRSRASAESLKERTVGRRLLAVGVDVAGT